MLTIYPPDLKTIMSLNAFPLLDEEADRKKISLKQGIEWNRGLW
jgi:hypothetical protein